MRSVKKSGQNLNALSKVTLYIDFSKRHMLVNAFLSHFNYCSSVWMCMTHIKINRINLLRERRLRLTCKSKESSFFEVLEEMVLS